MLLVFGAGFRIASHEAAVSSAVPNVNGSEVQRERAQRDAVDWGNQLASLPPENDAAFKDIRTVGSLLKRHGNSVRALALNRDAERHFAHMLAAVRGIPDYPEADLNELRDSLVGLLVLRHRAAQLYVRALEDNARRGIPLTEDTRARALLDEGDRLLDRADKQEPPARRADQAHEPALLGVRLRLSRGSVRTFPRPGGGSTRTTREPVAAVIRETSALGLGGPLCAR